MAYTQKTIPEFVLASTINNSDLIPISQNGVTKRIPFSSFKTVVPNYGYLTAEFENSDLSGNILTINHAKNATLVDVKVFNPGGVREFIPYTIIDGNNVSINFGGIIESGTWIYVLEYWGGTGSGYPDPTYEAALTKGNLTLNQATKNAAITVDYFSAYQFGNIVTVSAKITSTLAFPETESGGIVGVLSDAPISTQYFPGAIRTVAFYESAWGEISNTGQIKVYLGKAGRTYLFNFSFSIV